LYSKDACGYAKGKLLKKERRRKEKGVKDGQVSQ